MATPEPEATGWLGRDAIEEVDPMPCLPGNLDQKPSLVTIAIPSLLLVWLPPPSLFLFFFSFSSFSLFFFSSFWRVLAFPLSFLTKLWLRERRMEPGCSLCCEPPSTLPSLGGCCQGVGVGGSSRRPCVFNRPVVFVLVYCS